MRVGYDGVNPRGCPPGGDVYFGYVDGDYRTSFAGMESRFPGKVYVSITVKVDGDAYCADVEKGDLTPVEAAAWVKLRRMLGHPYATLYCSESNVGVCVQELIIARVPAPWYFGYANIVDFGVHGDPTWSTTLPPGVVILWKQYEQQMPFNGSAYDKSSVADVLPGIDEDPMEPIDVWNAQIVNPTNKASLPAGQRLLDVETSVNVIKSQLTAIQTALASAQKATVDVGALASALAPLLTSDQSSAFVAALGQAITNGATA